GKNFDRTFGQTSGPDQSQVCPAFGYNKYILELPSLHDTRFRERDRPGFLTRNKQSSKLPRMDGCARWKVGFDQNGARHRVGRGFDLRNNRFTGDLRVIERERDRSEERRVGKEWRSRGGPPQQNKRQQGP